MQLKEFQNILGWHSNKKIIVIESDDWGSDRFDLKSKKYYSEKGVDITLNWMSRFDTFESKDDMEGLLAILRGGFTGTFQPRMTLLFNPANPDFTKIMQGDFKTYYYQTFKEKLFSQGIDGNALMEFYNCGIHEGLLEIGFHGREHLYVNRWLRDLRSGNSIACEGFKQGVWGFSNAYLSGYNSDYRASFDLDIRKDLDFQSLSIKDGVEIIRREFNLEVKYFLAPNGPFSLSLLSTLEDLEIKYIGISKRFKDAETKINKFFWLNNRVGNYMKAITRNAIFEPSSPAKLDWVGSCLNDISQSFKWKKPAVVSTHRVNYVSGLESSNSIHGLLKLRELLNQIHKNWPDTVFLTSSQLGDLMNNKVSTNKFP